MQTYEIAIKIAFITFPIIAFLITLPYMIKQYHKYGAIPFLRTIIVYSFVLYLMTSFFTVILPLPSFEEVYFMNKPWFQLVPFNFIREISMYSNFDITDFNTYFSSFKDPLIYINLFNLILTIPFGIYLRYYFKRKWWEVVFLSLTLSLFFEITQLSGLYGIYPRPYRLFDVDDLIVNTVGGLFGYILTPFFSFLLPTRDRLDEMSFERGKTVSFSRRLLAFLIDIVVVNVIIIILALLFNINFRTGLYSLFLLFYFLINVILFKGRTIGKMFVKIKIVDNNNSNAKVYKLMFRYILIYIIFYNIYDIISWSSDKVSESIFLIIKYSIYFSLIIIYVKTLFDILKKRRRFFYEFLSGTKVISTIKYKGKEVIEEDNDLVLEVNQDENEKDIDMNQ